MTKSNYRNKRAFAIRLFGIAMLVVSIFNLTFTPVTLIHEKNHSTEFVTGEVISVDGEEVKIYYILPGEDEGWLVTKQGTGWEKGDEVRVFYNPDDLSEKYIEGFEESPWSYVLLGFIGIAIGTAAIIVSRLAKKNDAVNEAIDMFDRK